MYKLEPTEEYFNKYKDLEIKLRHISNYFQNSYMEITEYELDEMKASFFDFLNNAESIFRLSSKYISKIEGDNNND